MRERCIRAASRIFLVMAILVGLAMAGQGAVPAAERQALIDLYLATGGDAWTHNDNWRKPGDPTQFNDPGTENTWYGITTDAGNTTVTALDLNTNNLAGEIPASLSSLVDLQVLHLYTNKLSGSIPAALGSLINLVELDLSQNQLSGAVPSELSALSGLQVLVLWMNQLEGPVPEWLGGLCQLQHLEIDDNLFSGPIPDSFRNLVNLQLLALSSPNLSGSLPAFLGDLIQLQDLWIYDSSISGPIPPELGRLTSLRTMVLVGNRLSGEIPEELGGMMSLEYLDLRQNLLTGPLLESFGYLPNLSVLALWGNCLTGPLPAAWANMSKMEILSLGGNELSGPLPDWLGNLTHLRKIWFGYDKFSGPLPNSLGNLSNLTDLNVYSNQLNGPIPPSLGNLTQLKQLCLSLNRMSGSIPAEIGNLVNLEFLGLGGNQFTGSIPATLMQLTHMTTLDLDNNALHADTPALADFINTISGGDYRSSQTLPPTSLLADDVGPGLVWLSWTPDPSSLDDYLPGGYEIWSQTLGSPSTLRMVTRDKWQTDWFGTLTPGMTNYFRVRSYNDPWAWNPNKVYSEFTPTLTVNPPGGGHSVTVYVDTSRHGDVYADSPAQVVPASPLTVRINPADFSDASPDNRYYLYIVLPPGVLLGQTMAAPGRELDLAIVEYRLGVGGLPEPVEGNPLASIGAHAVQLRRYIAGEDMIAVRIQESTAHWTPHNGGDFLGFTIGLAAGAWPATGASNWGPDGIGTQASTLLCLDLRQGGLAAGSEFRPTICALKVPSWQTTPLTFDSAGYKLFTVDQVLSGEIPFTFALGTSIADFDTADIDGDGVDDLVAVTPGESRVYWSLGQRGGGFAGISWTDLPLIPVRVDVADVDGDGRPDVLAADAAGTLHVYLWDSLFGPGKAAKAAAPDRSVRLSGIVTDARVCDIDGDGRKDYVFCDAAAGKVHVLAGPGFTADQAYTAGAEPSALAAGDFNADGAPDLAAANAGGFSVSVFWNDGTGHFTPTTLADIGARPMALAAGDFNRDGLDDLAVALADDKAVGILLATSGNHFATAQEQKIFFQATPSAVLAENFDGEAGADALVGFADSSKLALCVSDAAGALQHRYSIDTLGDGAVDPSGQTVTLAADQVLSVAGGTSLGGVATRQGAAVIASRGVNLIHFPRSRDLSFSVVNLGAADALVNLELYADAGGAPLATATDSIPAGAQYARYLSGVLGPAADQPGRWVRAFLTAPDTYGIWLVNDPALTYLDGTRMPDARDARSRLLFPVVQTGGGGVTTFELINPLRLPTNLVFTVYGPTGMVKSTQTMVLGGRGRLELDTAARFPGITAADSVEVAAERGIVGLELFGGPHTVACLEAMDGDSTGTVLYAPHVASGDFGAAYQSILTLVNTAVSPLTVDLSLYADDGSLVAGLTRQLPAHGKLEEEIGELFGLTGTFTGYLAADPQGSPGLAGSLTFGEAGVGRFLSSLPLAPQAHNRFLLGHIANGRIGGVDYFTGLALLNPDRDNSSRVQLTAYDQDGRVLDSRFLLLQPPNEDCPDCGVRRVFLLDDLMPGLTDIFGGYLVIENQANSAGVLVFELFGDWDLNVLSAVPAVPLRD